MVEAGWFARQTLKLKVGNWSSTFAWCHLYFNIVQNKIEIFLEFDFGTLGR